jgi:hypothetical protein
MDRARLGDQFTECPIASPRADAVRPVLHIQDTLLGIDPRAQLCR